MIFIAGMSVAVFFEFLLITKKNKSEPDKILAFWMFLITVHLFLYYISFTGEIYNYPFLLGTISRFDNSYPKSYLDSLIQPDVLQ